VPERNDGDFRHFGGAQLDTSMRHMVELVALIRLRR
jgi:hypothetical protein